MSTETVIGDDDGASAISTGAGDAVGFVSVAAIASSIKNSAVPLTSAKTIRPPADWIDRAGVKVAR